MKKALRAILFVGLLVTPGFYAGYALEAPSHRPNDPWLVWIVPYLVGVMLLYRNGRWSAIVGAAALVGFSLWMLAELFTGT